MPYRRLTTSYNPLSHRLALVPHDQGNLTDSRHLQEYALATLEQTLGPDHQFTIEARQALRSLTPEPRRPPRPRRSPR